MRMHLLRHGQTELAPGFCYGSSDLAVAQEEHARIVATVVPLLPAGIPLFSSPLRRCRELARLLADELGSTIAYDARLAEMHFGAWEMRQWDDIPRAQIDAWAADPVAYRPGDGESVLEVAERVQAFHSELSQSQYADVLVVCHAGTIRLLSECRAGAAPEQMAASAARTRHSIAYGELLTIDC